MDRDAYRIFPHPWMDNTLRPLYVLRPPARFQYEDFAAFMRAQDGFMRNIYHSYGHVICMDHILSITARDRALFAAYEREYREVERIFNVGQAFVLTRPILRGMLRAVQWMAPPVYPWRVVSSEAWGVRWVQSQLDSNNTALRTDMRRSSQAPRSPRPN